MRARTPTAALNWSSSSPPCWSSPWSTSFPGRRFAKIGGTAFGEKGVSPVGKYDGYAPLVVEIVKFFRSKEVPVSEEETLQIYAFMEAADESKRRDGKPVALETVMEKARDEAAKKVAAILARN